MPIKMFFDFNGKKVKTKGHTCFGVRIKTQCTTLANSKLMATLSRQPESHLFFRLTVLSFPRLLLDVSDHGKGSSVVAVGQVDDIGNGREHGSLAAGTNGCALLTHSQEELERITGKDQFNANTWYWEGVNIQGHPNIRTAAHRQTTQVHIPSPLQVSCRPELAFQLPRV